MQTPGAAADRPGRARAGGAGRRTAPDGIRARIRRRRSRRSSRSAWPCSSCSSPSSSACAACSRSAKGDALAPVGRAREPRVGDRGQGARELHVGPDQHRAAGDRLDVAPRARSGAIRSGSRRSCSAACWPRSGSPRSWPRSPAPRRRRARTSRSSRSSAGCSGGRSSRFAGGLPRHDPVPLPAGLADAGLHATRRRRLARGHRGAAASGCSRSRSRPERSRGRAPPGWWRDERPQGVRDRGGQPPPAAARQDRGVLHLRLPVPHHPGPGRGVRLGLHAHARRGGTRRVRCAGTRSPGSVRGGRGPDGPLVRHGGRPPLRRGEGRRRRRAGRPRRLRRADPRRARRCRSRSSPDRAARGRNCRSS